MVEGAEAEEDPISDIRSINQGTNDDYLLVGFGVFLSRYVNKYVENIKTLFIKYIHPQSHAQC